MSDLEGTQNVNSAQDNKSGQETVHANIKNINLADMSSEERISMLEKLFVDDDFPTEYQEDEEKNDDEKTDDDVVPEHDEGDKKAAEVEASEINSNPYTPEEFYNLSDVDVLNMDFERLPGAGKVVAERLLGIYRGKIEPQLMELQTLREEVERHRKNLSQAPVPGSEAAKGDPANNKKAFITTVKNIAENELGINSGELDLYNPEHNAMFSIVAARLENYYDSQRQQQTQESSAQDTFKEAYNRMYADMLKVDPNFTKIEGQFINAFKTGTLTMKEYYFIKDAFDRKDINALKNIFIEVRRRYYEDKKQAIPPVKRANNKASAEIQKKQTEEPPHVVGGSGNSETATRKYDVKNISGMTTAERAELYIKMGLV